MKYEDVFLVLLFLNINKQLYNRRSDEKEREREREGGRENEGNTKNWVVVICEEEKNSSSEPIIFVGFSFCLIRVSSQLTDN